MKKRISDIGLTYKETVMVIWIILGILAFLFLLFIFALCKSAGDADDLAERAGRIVDADRELDQRKN